MHLHYPDLILYRTYADLKAEAERTYLGLLWWVIEPVLSMAIYYFVFAVVLKRGTEDFVAFLLVGIVMWRWYASSLMGGTKSIIQNKSLVLKTPIHKAIYPVVYMVGTFIKFCFPLLLLIVFLWIYGFLPQVHYVALPLVLLSQAVIILGFVMPLSALAPFLPDISNVLGHVIRLFFYMSGVLYSRERLPEEYRFVFDYNPMALVIQSYRDILMYDRWPQMPLNLIGATALCAVFAGLGFMMIHRLNGVYATRMEL